MVKIKTIFGYYGGKSKHIKHLSKFIPHHKYYVEVFGGSCAFLLNKEKAYLEICNDINGDIINFFTVLIDDNKRQKLIEKLKLTPYSREIHSMSIQQKKYNWDKMSDVDKAYWFYVSVLLTRMAVPFNHGWRFEIKYNKNVKSFRNKIDSLDEFAERLKYVQFENSSFDYMFGKYISKYSHDDAFVYLDPPYLHDTRKEKKMYDYEMSEEEHKKMLDLVVKYKNNAKFLISGYENELYNNILLSNGFKLYKWKTVSTVNSNKATEKNSRVECVWYNYNVEGGQCPERKQIALKMI